MYVIKNDIFQFYKHITILTLCIFSCSSTDVDSSVPLSYGKYTTELPSIPIRLKYSKKYKSNFWEPWKMVLELKDDSSYVIGFCKGNIRYSGNWNYHGDSVLLFNSYDSFQKKNVPDKKLYYEKDKGYIFYVTYDIDKKTRKQKNTTTTTLLKIGGNQFDGKLENE